MPKTAHTAAAREMRRRIGVVRDPRTLWLDAGKHPFRVLWGRAGLAMFSNLDAAVDTAITRGGFVVDPSGENIPNDECERLFRERPRSERDKTSLWHTLAQMKELVRRA